VTDDAGAPRGDVPAASSLCARRTYAADGTEISTGDADAGTDAGDAGIATPSVLPFGRGPTVAPRGGAAALGGRVMYVADDALPVVHAFDLSDPAHPVERPPLLATSIAQPAAEVTLSGLAVSPVTRDFKRYLYAIERRSGALMVFDVSDEGTPPRVPLTRPHPELNPFGPVDRVEFASPVVAVTFVRHDWPLTRDLAGNKTAALTGLLCNPSPAAGLGIGPYSDPGANYRANAQDENGPYVPVALGPGRLRGVFGFAVLSTGQTVSIDVEDWDAPCRRPDPMSSSEPTSSVAPPQPLPAAFDSNPFHVPLAYEPSVTDITSGTTPVSVEAFFPVSAPHRARSLYLLRTDPTNGAHMPYLSGIPSLVYGNAVLPTTGNDAVGNPVMLPTWTAYADPSIYTNPAEPNPDNRTTALALAPLPQGVRIENADEYVRPGAAQGPGIRFSFEDPLVHFNQDWTVTYEGTLPTNPGQPAQVHSYDGYHTIIVSNPTAHYCRAGVMDQAVGREMAEGVMAALGRDLANRDSLPVEQRLDVRVGDYVQVADDVPDPTDTYWNEDDPEGCWADTGLDTADARYAACSQAFGYASEQNVLRDYPVLEAYEDHLVLGRFGYVDGGPIATTNRTIVGASDTNVRQLKALRCCFRRQVGFNVRTGGQWLAIGSVSGYMHHLRADSVTRACRPSCDIGDRLLNGRSLEVPRPAGPDAAKYPIPDRSSPLAMRTPQFAVVMWGGAPAKAPEYTTTKRDYVWRFSTRGQFSPLVINLADQGGASNPQSIRFVESLGQVAVVDGAQQGLTLISLESVTKARPSFL
jgi:hypothetical protein